MLDRSLLMQCTSILNGVTINNPWTTARPSRKRGHCSCRTDSARTRAERAQNERKETLAMKKMCIRLIKMEKENTALAYVSLDSNYARCAFVNKCVHHWPLKRTFRKPKLFDRPRARFISILCTPSKYYYECA